MFGEMSTSASGFAGKARSLANQAAPLEERRDIRLHADGVRVHAEEQMVHGGVAGDGDAEDAVGRDAGGLAHQAHHRRSVSFRIAS